MSFWVLTQRGQRTDRIGEAETETAKFWLRVLTDLKNRGLKDILIACCDGLVDFPQAIEASLSTDPSATAYWALNTQPLVRFELDIGRTLSPSLTIRWRFTKSFTLPMLLSHSIVLYVR
jgi:hypothetical protein